MKRTLGFTCFALIGLGLLAGRVQAAEPTGDPTGTAALAERLARMGQIALQAKPLDDDNWRQATALLRAAVRLKPDEARFSRLLVDSCLQINDSEGAIAALELYLKARPADQLSKLQLIDLYLSQMETSEKRLAYLTDQIINNEALPAEMRSAAAVRAARLYVDRDQQQNAFDMVDQAVALEPLNPEAAAMSYQKAAAVGDEIDRMKALVRMVRSNPAQPAAMAGIGDELANAGIHDIAQQWYARAFELAGKMNSTLQADTYLNAAASALILGQSKTAEARALSLLASDPNNIDAHLIRLMAVRRLGTPEQVNSTLSDLTLALIERANNVYRKVHEGADAPTTQPSGAVMERIPNPSEQIKELKALGDAQLIEYYADCLVNLTWSQIAFVNDQAVGAQLLSAIKEIVPADSVVVARLEGWALLTAGQTDEARNKLSAVADRDPISRMGLILMDVPADRAKADKEAAELLSQHSSGLLGAMISGGFADLDLRGTESANAGKLRDALSELPIDWLGILESPSDFYTLSAETVRVSHGFGEPMIVTTSIKNTSKYDIAMGPAGTIRPDLWFDVTLKGIQQQNLPGVMFDRMGGKLILRRSEAVSHVTRADQGQLWQLMQAQPATVFPLYFSVFTNPAPAATVAAPGPGGYRVQFRKPIERTGTSMMDPAMRQQIFNKVALGTAGEKIRLEEMFAQYISLMGSQQEQDMAESILLLRQAIEQGMGESDVNVHSWSGYVTTLLEPEPRKTQLATRLANSREWLARLLVSASAEALTPETREAILQKLSADPDPIVAQHAAATLIVARRPPPATQPADGEAPPAGN